MNQPLRIGLVGFGKIGQIHYRHLQNMPGVRVSAIADKSDFSGLANSDIFSCSDWRKLVHREDIDAVVISLPHSLHAECTEAALRTGKHVFLEKPLATKLEDAQKLARCAEETRCTLMVNMTHRFYPPVQRARELLREGAIGQVISVRDYYMEIIDRSDFPGWFFDPILAGGGVAMTDSIHLIDRVSWLLDEPLQFVGGASRRLHPESLVEDCAEILCSSQSGVPITIGSFFFSGPKSWADGLTLFGTEGTMTVQAWSHVEWQTYGGKTHREEGYAPSLPQAERPRLGLLAALTEFVEAVRGGRDTETNAQSVLNAQEIIEKFYQFTSPLES